MPPTTRYCADTSALIAAWEERYPPENFPKFWDYVDRLAMAGRLIVTELVLDETSRKSKELEKWLRARPHAVAPLDEPIQLEAKAILAAHQRLVAEKKQRFAADSFVIATARVRGLVVVTEEKPTGNLNRPNIPDVCNVLGQDYIGLLDLIRAEGWIMS